MKLAAPIWAHGRAEVNRENSSAKKIIDKRKIANIQFASSFERFQDAVHVSSL
jgi:hypothetical protein